MKQFSLKIIFPLFHNSVITLCCIVGLVWFPVILKRDRIVHSREPLFPLFNVHLVLEKLLVPRQNQLGALVGASQGSAQSVRTHLSKYQSEGNLARFLKISRHVRRLNTLNRNQLVKFTRCTGICLAIMDRPTSHPFLQR